MPTLAHREYLDVLPSEWEQVRLGDLGDVYAGSTPRRSEPKYWEGHIPWLTPSEVTGRTDKWVNKTDEYITDAGYQSTSVHLVPEGSLLVTTRATIGEAVIAGVPITTNQGFKNLVLGPDDDPLFYYYVLRFVADEMKRLASGSTFDEINKSDFTDIVVPRPNPSEQRRIADVLDTVDAAIQETDAVVEKQEQVKTGLLQDLLTRGLDADGRLRDPERQPEAFRETEVFGRTPVDWEIVRLRDHITLPSGQIDPRKEPYRDWTLVAPNHIEEKTGRLLESETAAEQGAKSGKYVFREGNIVYSKIRPYLRKAYLADGKGICSADMYPLRPGERIRPRMLEAIILGEHFSRFAEKVSMRSGIPKINRAELGEYETALPPLDEQKRIEEVLVEHDQNVGAERSYRGKLQQLKTGLMQDLLTGRIRVPEAQERVDEVIA
jgi:type I restriction enzyme S subunit